MPGWGTTGLIPCGIGEICGLAAAGEAVGGGGGVDWAVGCGTTGLMPAEEEVYVELVAELRLACGDDSVACCCRPFRYCCCWCC